MIKINTTDPLTDCFTLFSLHSETDTAILRKALSEQTLYVIITINTQDHYWMIEDLIEFQLIHCESLRIHQLKQNPPIDPRIKNYHGLRIPLDQIYHECLCLFMKVQRNSPDDSAGTPPDRVQEPFIARLLTFLSDKQRAAQLSGITRCDWFKNRCLLSLQFIDGGAWQAIADTWSNQATQTMTFYIATGMGGGVTVFIAHLLEDFISHTKRFRQENITLRNDLMNALASASLYGFSALLSNAVWQYAVNLATTENTKGINDTEELPAYVYTGAFCATAAWMGLVVLQSLYRMSGIDQAPLNLTQRMYLFFAHDLPYFFRFCFIYVTCSATFFCLTLFNRVFGLPLFNPFMVSPPVNTTSRIGNVIKAASATYLGFWLGAFIYEIFEKIHPSSSFPIERLKKQIETAWYPTERSHLLA